MITGMLFSPKQKMRLHSQPEQRETTKKLLISLLIGNESRMVELCERYFTLSDILMIASREVGTGFIGGKSVGMLLARKILEQDEEGRFTPFLEPHDSFYLGSDVFYTYIVQNGWWKLRTKQKTKDGYFTYAPELKEKLLQWKISGEYSGAVCSAYWSTSDNLQLLCALAPYSRITLGMPLPVNMRVCSV